MTKTPLLLEDKLIEEELLRSGFPLEVYISNLLDKNDWEVYKSPKYFDKDENKLREMDIIANKSFDNFDERGEIDNSVNVYLIISCKKSEDHPWIFWNNADDNFVSRLGVYKLFDEEKREEYQRFSPFDYGKTYEYEYKRQYNYQQHKSFCELIPNRDNKNNLTSYGMARGDQIYPTFVELVKCLAYEFEKDRKFYSKDIYIFYPIVVFDGSLWSASLANRSKISLLKSSRLAVEFSYYSNFLPSKKSVNDYCIEVISSKVFKNFIVSIEKDSNRMKNNWQKFINRFKDSDPLETGFSNPIFKLKKK